VACRVVMCRRAMVTLFNAFRFCLPCLSARPSVSLSVSVVYVCGRVGRSVGRSLPFLHFVSAMLVFQAGFVCSSSFLSIARSLFPFASFRSPAGWMATAGCSLNVGLNHGRDVCLSWGNNAFIHR